MSRRDWRLTSEGQEGVHPIVVEVNPETRCEEHVATVETWPDAALIAAAPELLRTLKALVSAYDADGGVLNGPGSAALTVAYVEARTAIATAPEGAEEVTP